ncbi:hypothetical protein FOQG_10829 [Fusarium oxysporum f. sp. raphani 54005]|uniref:VOC domain-containing protein n=3 Tax=Fusarium oxysporum TaxID=5507 RepID=X0BSQ8_FUSOX|nr:hypothetical protein FOVG_03724 [Fusarium oxysporum f. sp. pisi HDV247]EXK85175.1 hypothetical protein FOQG_10829 [Fusarium oxysporum f. sp. raphani 54005]KAG7436000.1 Biphenyl-2,3-diol 1,2-dioxygenase 3 [Fusarium oxysporum f. sp. raphani]KAJ4030519.1 hypothetical protein NW758_012897 [Fusarium oxysporum]WKT43681.1 Glyoxalase/Bleomycin resistance protein/Dihydroxybiphenyl dioxygenase [Fusarium oxysporum f. sp. vasinfectum]
MTFPGIPNFDASYPKVMSPEGLAHVVLRTSDLKRMQEFYTTFLGGTVTYGSEVISFITYDEEHHRIALLEVPDTKVKNPLTCGLEHIAFSFGSLSSLLLAYRQRKAKGIHPIWCVNHGPTTSIYYKDPDGNMLETQVDNFDTVYATTQFMTSESFAENPVGTDFDPEELISAIQKGVPESTLKQRKEIGARPMPDLASM